MSSLRELERESIRAFVESFEFKGKVLDYGAGKSPYADHVLKTATTYVPYDRADFPGTVVSENIGEMFPLIEQYDAILCTQVVQYVKNVRQLAVQFRQALRQRHGTLILTYPTNWPEVETADIHRFTKSGMEELLIYAGFDIIRHERRAHIYHDGEFFALGYGVEARS